MNKKLIVCIALAALCLVLGVQVLAYDSPCLDTKCGTYAGKRIWTECEILGCTLNRDRYDSWTCYIYDCVDQSGNYYTAYVATATHSYWCETSTNCGF